MNRIGRLWERYQAVSSDNAMAKCAFYAGVAAHMTMMLHHAPEDLNDVLDELDGELDGHLLDCGASERFVAFLVALSDVDEARRRELAAEKARGREGYYLITFRDPTKPPGEEGMLGVIIVKALGPRHADMKTWILNINPGGESLTGEIRQPPESFMDRLLTLEEVDDLCRLMES